MSAEIPMEKTYHTPSIDPNQLVPTFTLPTSGINGVEDQGNILRRQAVQREPVVGMSQTYSILKCDCFY